MYSVFMLIAIIFSTMLTALKFDTNSSSFHEAEKACNVRASGSHVRSFDFNTATCDNGVSLEYRNRK